MLEELLDLREGLIDDLTLLVLNDLAVLLLDLDEAESAEELCIEAIDCSIELRGAMHRETLTLRSNLADALRMRGAFHESVSVEHEVLRLRRQQFGRDDPDTLTSLNNLAATYVQLGRLHEALNLQAEVLQVRRLVLIPDHVDTITAMGNLAVTYYRLGDWDQALKLERQVLADRVRIQTPQHNDTLLAKNNLAGTLREFGDADEALALLEELHYQRRQNGEADSDIALTELTNLADLLCKKGELPRARALAEDALRSRQSKDRPLDPSVLTAMGTLAAVQYEQGDLNEALGNQQLVLGGRRLLLGHDHPDTLLAQNDLATMLLNSGDTATACELFSDVLTRQERLFGETHVDSLSARINLAGSIFHLGDTDTAVPLAARAVEILSERLTFYADDFKAAEKAFRILASQRADEALRRHFAAVSATMCLSMELRSQRSAAFLWPHFMSFHRTWHSFCLDYYPEDLPSSLIATHGLEASAVVLSALSQTTEPADADPQRPERETLDARGQLTEARVRLMQIDVALKSVEQNLQLPVQDGSSPLGYLQLIERRAECTKQEREAIEQYQAAKKRLLAAMPEFAVAFWFPWQTTRQLAESLQDDEALVLLWEQAGGEHVASAITRRFSQHIRLPSIAPLLQAVSRYDRLFDVGMRGTRLRDDIGDAQGDPLDAERCPSRTELLEDIRSLCKEAWGSLRAGFPEAKTYLLVTGPGLHSMPIDAGNPGFDAHYFLGLPSYYLLRHIKPLTLYRSLCPESVEVVVDPAWDSSIPIPFVEAEARLIQMLIPGSDRVDSLDWKKRLHSHRGRLRRRVALACHGRRVGDGAQQYPALVIDSASGELLDPVDLHGVADQIEELFCSACVGGLVSQTEGGDALGIVSALQLHGVNSVVASSAALPDFYMPIVSALYWHARRTGLSANHALTFAKQSFCSGDWPEGLVTYIEHAYLHQVEAVLSRAASLASPGAVGRAGDSPRHLHALSRTIASWPWPETIIAGGRSWQRATSRIEFSELLRECCYSGRARQGVARQIVDELLSRRHHLPHELTEHIQVFLSCYG